MWIPTKHFEKKVAGNYTRMLRTVLNKFWKEHTKKQQLYGHLPPISQTLQERRTHARTNSYRLLHMDMSMLVDQQRCNYISSLQTQYTT